eukprot:9869827-Alexandrium_andersonii.AAC.1
MLCPCPQTTPRYETVSMAIAPYFFSFDSRAEAFFEEVGMCRSEAMDVRGKERLAIPALNETVEFISASETGTGVMRALAPGTMMTLYVGNIIHP